MTSNNDDDLLEIKSLDGMLDEEEEEKLPDDQLQHVVNTSNVNTPKGPPMQPQIPLEQPPSSTIPPDSASNTFPPKSTNRTAQVPMPTTHPQSVKTPVNQTPSTRQPPVNVTRTTSGSNQKQRIQKPVFPPPGSLFNKKQQKKKDKPISILSFNSMVIKMQQHLLINVVEPTFIKRLQDVDMHDRDEQMKIVNAYFYDKSQVKCI